MIEDGWQFVYKLFLEIFYYKNDKITNFVDKF